MGTRSLYLVRHGHYHTDKDSARYGKLTALGRRQAIRVGKRLASIELDVMHHSDTLRAVETAEIIAKQLALEIPTRTSKLLREGVPTAPGPWLPHFTRAESEENPSPKQHALRLHPPRAPARASWLRCRASSRTSEPFSRCLMGALPQLASSRSTTPGAPAQLASSRSTTPGAPAQLASSRSTTPGAPAQLA